MDSDADTIVAIATPPGRGGVGVIRLSGSRAYELLQAISDREHRPRCATYTPFYSKGGQLVDRGIALFFPGPESFTGEDVAELQAHGSPVILGSLVTDLVARGARLARPGEFSQRAFLNGKLDLTQAEAIADLISAGSEQAARSAMRSLEGDFAASVTALRQALVELQVQLEAELDFADETFGTSSNLLRRLAGLQAKLRELLATAHRAQRIQEGLQIVLIGRPNVGKSSLLNRLAGTDSAIVSDLPGTTRDAIVVQTLLGGVAVQLVDTAGIRPTTDPVEIAGIDRTWRATDRADLVFIVIDFTNYDPAADLAPLAQMSEASGALLVFNKTDLSSRAPGLEYSKPVPEVFLSAKTGHGIELLDDFVRRYLSTQSDAELSFSARRRHVEALQKVDGHLGEIHRMLENSPVHEELIAEHVRSAQHLLGAITGVFTSEDLLGEIFQSFCIGK